ncbi:MAG TPA: hypothetical protein VNT75_32195 [Symbiobacteriaceae bacterium]|nr:hypothetical protein [Symbiobacteriaceae bacterium]
MDHDNRQLQSRDRVQRLTDMELLMVQHALDAEVLGLKKCLHYSQEVGDENARQLMREHADIHHRRVDMMLALLDAPGDISTQAKLLLQTEGMQGGNHRA